MQELSKRTDSGAPIEVPVQTDSWSRSSNPVIDIYTERGNLYPLSIDPIPATPREVASPERGRTRRRLYLDGREQGTEVSATPDRIARAVKRKLVEALKGAGFRLSRDENFLSDTRNGRVDSRTPFLREVPSYRLRVMEVGEDLYLCLNHHLHLKNCFQLARLREIDPDLALRPSQQVFVRDEGDWVDARFVEEASDGCRVAVLDAEGAEIEVVVPTATVLPELGREQVAQLAGHTGQRTSELEQRLKRLSLLTVPRPPEARLQLVTDFVAYVAERCFPLVEGTHTITVDPTPARLMPPRFDLRRDLTDPQVALDYVDATKRAGDILGGLSRYGSYEKPGAAIRLALLAPADRMPQMRHLVERLNRGADRYRGALATFSITFDVVTELTGSQHDGYRESIRQLTRSPQGETTDVVLAYMPRGAYATRPDHPYFAAKKALLREGLASQMVDEATLVSPRMKDLNLGLNLFAKAGFTPWVLDEGIEGVDLFIGLSYTARRVRGRIERMMAYVNVFDRYGRWRLYQGDAKAFPFDDRLDHLRELVADALAGYRAQAPGEHLRTIHIHYTKRFSFEEMETIAETVRATIQDASIAFVSVNVSHPLRLFDLRADGDGAVARATYLMVGPKRLYLATTGANPFGARMMGTPVPLELTVWTYPREYRPALQAIAQEALALTRLNWASTRPFSREPITTKFAGEIAYALGAFMDDPTFSVNPRLRNRPWFL